MVTVRVTATATVTFTMHIDEIYLIDQSIREYVEEVGPTWTEADIESIDGDFRIEDVEVE